MSKTWKDETITINGWEYPAWIEFDGNLHRGYVTINQRKYPIYLASNDILRFVPQTAVSELLNLDLDALNHMKRLLFANKITVRDYIDFYTMHDGSVGYLEDAIESTLVLNSRIFTGKLKDYFDHDFDQWRSDYRPLEND